MSRHLQQWHFCSGQAIHAFSVHAHTLNPALQVQVRHQLLADSLASGDLVEPLPNMRIDSPLAHWLIVGPRNEARPEVAAFCEWLKAQALLTREAIGDMPDADTLDNLD